MLYRYTCVLYILCHRLRLSFSPGSQDSHLYSLYLLLLTIKLLFLPQLWACISAQLPCCSLQKPCTSWSSYNFILTHLLPIRVVCDLLIYSMCLGVLPACIYVYYMRAWCPRRTEEGTGSHETGIADGYERPCGRWEPNPSPPQEHQAPHPRIGDLYL